MYKIYTDGSYKPTTNQGGYAVIITKDDDIEIFKQDIKKLTDEVIKAKRINDFQHLYYNNE